jgi:hypothetical protein
VHVSGITTSLLIIEGDNKITVVWPCWKNTVDSGLSFGMNSQEVEPYAILLGQVDPQCKSLLHGSIVWKTHCINLMFKTDL